MHGKIQKSEENSHFKYRHREDNIKMDLRETLCEHVDWIHVFQGKDQWWALVNTTMNISFP
jgi:hypothetical protein